MNDTQIWGYIDEQRADADFSVGSGDEVRGRIQDIVMTLSGRRAGLPVE